MDVQRITNTLKLIYKTYKPILEQGIAERAISEAVSGVDISRRRFDRGEQPTWGYSISDSLPLRFKPSMIMKGVHPQVDVYCNIQWSNSDLPAKQDIKVRVWSRHRATIFDPQRDAADLEKELFNPERGYPGRVVSRFHFDRVDHSQGKGTQYHPTFHFQVGGKAEQYELCWHPKSFDIPRLGYQPMELFLTCQLVAANFFRDEYDEIRKRREWKELLIQYQKILLRDYYDSCLRAIDDGKSLIDELDSL